MKMNMNALKVLELKLAKYSKENGAIAEHESSNTNCSAECYGTCSGSCRGLCKSGCGGGCQGGTTGR